MNRKSKNNTFFSSICIFFCLLFLCLLGWVGFYISKNGILLKEGSDFVQYGSTYNPKETISYVFFGKPKDVQVETNVDSNKMGTYKTTYKFKNYLVETKVEVKDTLPPKLELKDYTTDMVEEVKVKKFIKNVSDRTKVKTEIENIEKKDESNFVVMVKAEDSSGNITRKKANLKRIKDEEGPTISAPEHEMYETHFFDEMKDVKVVDNLDKNPTITCNADEVLTGPGDIEVTYTATDRSGNKTEFKRMVHVLPSPEMNEKIMYLTFDDGPSEVTAEVLDVLDRYGVQATFFVTGYGQPYNDLIKRAYDAGHTIGLHTYTHDWSIYDSQEAYFADLQQIQDMVYDITGERSYIIRFPGGSSNTASIGHCEGIMTELALEVQKRGYDYFDWNVGSGDASVMTLDAASIVENSKIYDGDHLVLLMHDSTYKTTLKDALPAIIEFYQAEGYSFKGLSDLSPMCHHSINN
ncbi:MAG: polysaccharide deacetylase [Bacillota bacterium]|nr:polysaccharide deacetylase [Bacillota bacterium]